MIMVVWIDQGQRHTYLLGMIYVLLYFTYIMNTLSFSLTSGAFRSAEGLFTRYPSTSPIYSVTRCTGGRNCTFNIVAAPSTCSHDNDIGVFCREEGTPAVCRTGEVRLEGSSQPQETSREGRVEVCVDNQWGTICDDSWDDRSVNFVCNSLFGDGCKRTFSSHSILCTHRLLLCVWT